MTDFPKDAVDTWLQETKSRCARFSEEYGVHLGKLWWVNLILVVLPAVCLTAAAIFAAIPEEKMIGGAFGDWLLPPASILAGLAAIFVTIHRALKCDEYQAECLRLSQHYQGLVERMSAALARPAGERASLQEQIARDLGQLTESVKARLPPKVISKLNHDATSAG